MYRHQILSGALNILENRDFYARPVNFKDFECTLQELYEYEGIYKSLAGNRFTVSVEDERLQFSVPDVSIPIQCIGKDISLASVKDQSELVRFIRNDEEKIVRVAYHFRQYLKIYKG